MNSASALSPSTHSRCGIDEFQPEARCKRPSILSAQTLNHNFSLSCQDSRPPNRLHWAEKQKTKIKTQLGS